MIFVQKSKIPRKIVICITWIKIYSNFLFPYSILFQIKKMINYWIPYTILIVKLELLKN